MNQATDYLRGDVAIKGGLTSCLKTAHLAESMRMNYEVHQGGNSLINVANPHLIMAISNCAYFEVLLPNEAEKHGLVHDIEVDAQGLVHAHGGPGLGARIDFNPIKRNKLAELRRGRAHPRTTTAAGASRPRGSSSQSTRTAATPAA